VGPRPGSGQAPQLWAQRASGAAEVEPRAELSWEVAAEVGPQVGG